MIGFRLHTAITKLVDRLPEKLRPAALALLTEFAEALIEECRRP